MSEDDQKSASTETGSVDSNVKQSVASDEKDKQTKAPPSRKTILIGKAFVIGGVAIRVDDLPKKVRGGEEVAIHGLNLKIYNELALFVAGSWYRPINLHLARREGQAIEFTLPNFDRILQEGNDIWVRLSSSLFPVASGSLNKYIAYTFEPEEDEVEEKKKKEQAEKEKKEKFGKQEKDSSVGLSGLMTASVGGVLGNLAEPFLPAALKKDGVLTDAKEALKSGNKRALKDAVKKSKDFKDLKGLKNLLKDAGDSESRQFISESISELEKIGLAPKKLGAQETAKLESGELEEDITYLDDDSSKIQEAEAGENTARLELREQQKQDEDFAEQFEPEQETIVEDVQTKEKTEEHAWEGLIKPAILPENLKQSTELIGEHLDKNPGLISDPKVREKVLSALATGDVSGLDEQSLIALQGVLASSSAVSAPLSQAVTQVSGALRLNKETRTGEKGVSASTEKLVINEADANISALGESTVQGSAQTVSSDILETKKQTEVQAQGKSAVNIKGETGLNAQVEAGLKAERETAVAGAGSQVSSKLNSINQQSESSLQGFSSIAEENSLGSNLDERKESQAVPVKQGLETQSGQKPEDTELPNTESGNIPNQAEEKTNKVSSNFLTRPGLVGDPTGSGANKEKSQEGLGLSDRQRFAPPAGKLMKTIDPKIQQAVEIGKGLSGIAGRSDLGEMVEGYGKQASVITDRIDSALESKSAIETDSEKLAGSKADVNWVVKLGYTEKILKVAEEIATLTGREDIAEIARELQGIVDPNEIYGLNDAGAIRRYASNKAGEMGADLAKGFGGLAGNRAAAIGGALSGALQGKGVGGILKNSLSWYVLYIAFGSLFTLVGSIPALIFLDFYHLMSKLKISFFPPMDLWQKTVLLYANIVIGGGVIALFVILLFTGCTYPAPGKLSVLSLVGMSELCESVNNITSSGVQGSGVASQGGPVATTKWTTQINQVAGENSLNPCILRAVVQKQTDKNLDLKLIAQKMQIAISKNGNNLTAAFADRSGLGVSKSEAEQLTVLYNMCVNSTKGK